MTTTNQIEEFAGQAAATNMLDAAAYEASPLRLSGHVPGIASQALENAVLRNLSRFCRGLAEFIARNYAPGVVDDGDVEKIVDGMTAAVVAILEENVSIANATETVAGIIKQSTTAQALAGTDDTTAMSPADVASAVNAIISAAMANVAKTNVVNGYTKQQYPVPVEAAGVSGSVTLDCNTPEYWQALTGATTYANPSNMAKGKRVTLDLYAAAAQTVSWGSLWVDNTYVAKPTSLSAGQRLRMTFDCVWNYSLGALCLQLVGLVPGV